MKISQTDKDTESFFLTNAASTDGTNDENLYNDHWSNNKLRGQPKIKSMAKIQAPKIDRRFQS